MEPRCGDHGPWRTFRNSSWHKFKRIFTYAYEKSPFYRRKFDQAGIKPGDIQKYEDIRKVPLTEKQEMRQAQENKEPFPFGELITVPVEEVTAYHQTSGTTGVPVRYADTWEDWEWFSEVWAYAMYSRRFRNTDRIYLPFPVPSFHRLLGSALRQLRKSGRW